MFQHWFFSSFLALDSCQTAISIRSSNTKCLPNAVNINVLLYYFGSVQVHKFTPCLASVWCLISKLIQVKKKNKTLQCDMLNQQKIRFIKFLNGKQKNHHILCDSSQLNICRCYSSLPVTDIHNYWKYYMASHLKQKPALPHKFLCIVYFETSSTLRQTSEM